MPPAALVSLGSNGHLQSKESKTLFTLPSGKHFFTSIEDIHRENTLQLCSTNNIIWLDVRFPGKPLLAYAHGREFDGNLGTKQVNTSDDSSELHPRLFRLSKLITEFYHLAAFTFLTSRNNGLVTIYDVCQVDRGLIQFNQSPYALISPQNVYEKHIGQQFIPKGDGFLLTRLSETGSITCHEIKPSNRDMEEELVVEKSKEIEQLEVAASKVDIREDPIGGQDFTQVDLSKVYNGMCYAIHCCFLW